MTVDEWLKDVVNLTDELNHWVGDSSLKNLEVLRQSVRKFEKKIDDEIARRHKMSCPACLGLDCTCGAVDR